MEYIEFIKKFLIHKLYLDYCKQSNIYNIRWQPLPINELKGTPPKEECPISNLHRFKQTYTQNTQTETDIWNEVFKKNHAVLKYYLQLEKKTDITSNKTNNQANIYEHKTFQDYIDETINIKSINLFHYQEFIKSMKDETFKQNFQNKYEDYITETKLKNHLIYIVQLRIKSQSQKQNQYYTETEEYEMEASLNIIPYLEYVSHRDQDQDQDQDHQDQDQDQDQDQEIKHKTMTEINERTIETNALQAIDDFLFS